MLYPSTTYILESQFVTFINIVFLIYKISYFKTLKFCCSWAVLQFIVLVIHVYGCYCCVRFYKLDRLLFSQSTQIPSLLNHLTRIVIFPCTIKFTIFPFTLYNSSYIYFVYFFCMLLLINSVFTLLSTLCSLTCVTSFLLIFSLLIKFVKFKIIIYLVLSVNFYLICLNR